VKTRISLIYIYEYWQPSPSRSHESATSNTLDTENAIYFACFKLTAPGCTLVYMCFYANVSTKGNASLSSATFEGLFKVITCPVSSYFIKKVVASYTCLESGACNYCIRHAFGGKFFLEMWIPQGNSGSTIT